MFLKNNINLLSFNKVFALLALAGINISCSLSNTDDIIATPGLLRFSEDTIFFDTLFSEIPSITKRLKVYNDQDGTINISSIKLLDPETSYLLTLNGIEGGAFSNTKILGNDSLLILVKANINDRDSEGPYVIEDKLRFITESTEQEVSIFSWGQDAHYLNDSILTCNTNWTKGKPYVIYDHLLIDSLCTLTIEAGTRIYSHSRSNIYVMGTLLANGSPDERIVFMNDRFDGNYSQYPGQWGGIIFLEGSKDNQINYADIQNAEIGIWLGTPDDDDKPDLVMNNSSVVNNSEACVLAFTSDLEMNNCQLTNAGQFVFAGLAGGNYTLNHNTITNYSIGFFKSQPSFWVNTELELNDGSLLQAAVKLDMYNNIVWGISNDELELDDTGSSEFQLTMSNNLLRTTNGLLNQSNNILNQDPLFIDSSVFDFQLNEMSPAIDAGVDVGITLDINGKIRSMPPDIGAYERQ